MGPESGPEDPISSFLPVSHDSGRLLRAVLTDPGRGLTWRAPRQTRLLVFLSIPWSFDRSLTHAPGARLASDVSCGFPQGALPGR